MGGADAARLRWRCRRGLKELDVVLERFVNRHLPGLDRDQLDTLDRLLDAGDPELMDWILGRGTPGEPEFEPLLARLRELLPTQLPHAADD